MVLFFPCLFGVKIPLLLGERFGQRIEIEALEFINAIPIEWRLGTLPIRSPDGRRVFSSGNP